MFCEITFIVRSGSMVKTSRAIIIKDNKLLVFYRRKVINDEIVIYYSLPGGHVDIGEGIDECVVRELKEEMNLDIRVINYLGNTIVDNVEENYFHCEIVGGELRFGGEELERNCDNNYYEIRWLDISEIAMSRIRALDFVRKVVYNG